MPVRMTCHFQYEGDFAFLSWFDLYVFTITRMCYTYTSQAAEWTSWLNKPHIAMNLLTMQDLVKSHAEISGLLKGKVSVLFKIMSDY